MEDNLRSRGFEILTLGVEPSEVRNMQIYFKWGYDTFIKIAYERYLSENNDEEPEKIMVNYYSKKLKLKKKKSNKSKEEKNNIVKREKIGYNENIKTSPKIFFIVKSR